jgi:NADH-quinone oxidoreductase subunit A
MTVVLEQYASTILLLIMGLGLVVAFYILNQILAPQRSHKKGSDTLSAFVAYECGEVPVGEAHTRFNFQYYVFALVFVVFDVITAFLFPWALVIKNELGPSGMIAVAAFLGVFLIGFGYWWKRDALRWM